MPLLSEKISPFIQSTRFEELTTLPAFYKSTKFSLSLKNIFNLFPESKSAASFTMAISGNEIVFNCREGSGDAELCIAFITEYAKEESLDILCSEIFNKFYFKLLAKDRLSRDKFLLAMISVKGYLPVSSLHFDFNTKNHVKEQDQKSELVNTFSASLSKSIFTILLLPEYNFHTDEYLGDLQKEQIVFMSELLKSLNVTYTEQTIDSRPAFLISKEEEIVMLLDLFGKMNTAR